MTTNYVGSQQVNRSAYAVTTETPERSTSATAIAMTAPCASTSLPILAPRLRSPAPNARCR